MEGGGTCCDTALLVDGCGKAETLSRFGAAAPVGCSKTGDEVSKPASCAGVYICGGWFEEWVVSGRAYDCVMCLELRLGAWSLWRAKESRVCL